MNQSDFSVNVLSLPGPILITGAGGFVGSHLLKNLIEIRDDVFGTTRTSDSWRLEALGISSSIEINLTDKVKLRALLQSIKPKIVFNLAAYGAYSHQNLIDLTYEVNIGVVETLSEWCASNSSILIQAGSSSEYGTNCAAPLETDICLPNSRYAISKLAATNLLSHLSDSTGLASAVIRLYSIYGPLEDPTRLVPTLIRNSLNLGLPEFASKEVTRDFVYVDEAVSAFVKVGLHISKNQRFEIFNVASGSPTSMVEVANSAKSLFGIVKLPTFRDNFRKWDLNNWFGNAEKIKNVVGWTYSVHFIDGLKRTLDWYQEKKLENLLDPSFVTKSGDEQLRKISIVIACYRDEPAIPEMHNRLTKVLTKLDVNYEIIFVNDCSPDNSLDVIRKISATDAKTFGINHARNFGSQSAFLSGMTLATGDACVLMDGDLQDPPEIISDFVMKWRDGFDVVYGIRVDREASWLMRIAYKFFYRVLSAVSPFRVPRDAGDFSLIDRVVMNSMLAFPEREIFLRTSRAYSGHKQCGVDYVRPERPYGVSTNNFFKNVGWAVKGVLSVSKKPLTYMSICGIVLFLLASFTLIVQLLVKVFAPNSTPPGTVTTILVSMFFGSINLLGISIVGEYVGRVLEEVRGRPRFIVSSLISGGIEHPSNRIDSKDR
jgi:nucleoside-diphosphate-sugar epimerase/glycosyltransferase involved in cell wall biosynthesis